MKCLTHCIYLFSKRNCFFPVKKFPIQLKNVFVFSAVTKEWTRIRVNVKRCRAYSLYKFQPSSSYAFCYTPYLEMSRIIGMELVLTFMGFFCGLFFFFFLD